MRPEFIPCRRGQFAIRVTPKLFSRLLTIHHLMSPLAAAARLTIAAGVRHDPVDTSWMLTDIRFFPL